MRRRFAGNGQAFLLRPSDELHAFLCRNMADMVSAPRFAHELKIALDLFPFAFGGIADKPVCLGKAAVMNAPSLFQ